MKDFPDFMKNEKNAYLVGRCIAGTRSIHAFGGKRIKTE